MGRFEVRGGEEDWRGADGAGQGALSAGTRMVGGEEPVLEALEVKEVLAVGRSDHVLVQVAEADGALFGRHLVHDLQALQRL